MKNLRRRIRGRIVAGAPQNDMEQRVWKSMGYEQLPTGEWYEVEEEILGPSLEFMSRYPDGHVCKACRDHFRSARYHDAYCQSCRSIMELERKKIDAILDANSSGSPEAPQEALRKIQTILECPRCSWQANEGRIEPANIQRIREYLDDWIVAAHLHWMRHNFWNRFPYKSKFVSKEFVSKEAWGENIERNKFHEALDNYAKKNPNVIEITYSEAGVPVSAKQKHSKNVLQFPAVS
jgi:hypothetical protein